MKTREPLFAPLDAAPEDNLPQPTARSNNRAENSPHSRSTLGTFRAQADAQWQAAVSAA